MTRRRIRRLAIAITLATIASLGLAGCQSIQPGTITQAVARADVASWTQQVVHAAGTPPPATHITLNAFDQCQTDHSFFDLSSQWRTITELEVPLDQQASATTSIHTALEAAGWKATRSAGAVTFTGPTRAKHRGTIRVQTGGASALSVTVISPCYS